MKSFLARNRLPLAAFAVALAVYAIVAGPKRLGKPSSDPHFAAQAAAWLKGRVEVSPWPAGADDPARVCEVELDDGRRARGRWRGAPNLSNWCAKRQAPFRVAGGAELPPERVKRVVRTINYVSFPSFPSVLMLPQAAVRGARANDVHTTIFLAALVPAAFLVLLRRLREAKLSTRTQVEELWLAALLAFGTVFFFSAVQGRVWFTAHVTGVLLAILYAWASIEARHPLWAGVFLGLAFVTRTPMLFMFPLFAFESWRAGRAGFVRRGLLFAAPVAVIGALAAGYNFVRFHELTEFGHSYLAVRQQTQIDQYGLFDLHYLGRNLAVAFGLLPIIKDQPPYLAISGHGLAIWFTTPVLLLLLCPRRRGPVHLALWLTVALVASWSLLYQNSGWVQFGYRFSLDYMVYLIALLAIGGRPLGWLPRALIVVGIAVNFFGAVTFQRQPKYYRADNASYDCVIRSPSDPTKCWVRH